MNEINIDICIATFHRRELLLELLSSIFAQILDSNIKYRIIIVDNDKEGSARDVIVQVNKNTTVEIVYDIEPEQNIALVRNKTVSLAKGDYVIFVDDDETVAKDWLQQLINSAKKYDASVVFGPVLPEYSENTPGWIEKGRFFDRTRRQTGTQIKHGGTGNTLVKRMLFLDQGFLFDVNYGLTGGSDTELFYRVGKAGYKMVWCDEAIVSETVISKRLSAKWLIRRAFRGGQTYARIFLPAMGYREAGVWVMRRIIFLAFSIMFLPISWVGGMALFIKCLQKVASNTGQLLGLMGWDYQEYKL